VDVQEEVEDKVEEEEGEEGEEGFGDEEVETVAEDVIASWCTWGGEWIRGAGEGDRDVAGRGGGEGRGEGDLSALWRHITFLLYSSNMMSHPSWPYEESESKGRDKPISEPLFGTLLLSFSASKDLETSKERHVFLTAGEVRENELSLHPLPFQSI
jgi:hypothetical protein